MTGDVAADTVLTVEEVVGDDAIVDALAVFTFRESPDVLLDPGRSVAVFVDPTIFDIPVESHSPYNRSQINSAFVWTVRAFGALHENRSFSG